MLFSRHGVPLFEEVAALPTKFRGPTAFQAQQILRFSFASNLISADALLQTPLAGGVVWGTGIPLDLESYPLAYYFLKRSGAHGVYTIMASCLSTVN